MYLYFHLEFKICCIHIFSKRKLVYFFFFFFLGNTATFVFNFLVEINDIQKRISLKEPQFSGVGGYTYMKL